MKLLAAVLASIILTSATVHAVPMPQPTPMSRTIFTGSAAVEALNSTYYEVSIDSDRMTSPRLTGRLTAAGGSGNDIVVLVMSDADFMNWKNGHEVRPLFNSGQVTVADLDVALPGAGDYRLVLSNQFSSMTPKTVSGQVRLRWVQAPSPEEVAAAEAANKAELERVQRDESNTLLVGLLVVLVLGGLIGGLIAWMVAARKAKQPAPPQ